MQLFTKLSASTLIDSQKNVFGSSKTFSDLLGVPGSACNAPYKQRVVVETFEITTTSLGCTVCCKSPSSLVRKCKCSSSFIRFGISLNILSQSCSCTKVDKTIGVYEGSFVVATCVINRLSSASNSM